MGRKKAKEAKTDTKKAAAPAEEPRKRGRPKRSLKAAQKELSEKGASPAPAEGQAVTQTPEHVYSDNDQRMSAIREIFGRIGSLDTKLLQNAADRKGLQEQRESCFQEIKRITFDAQDRLPLAERTEERTCIGCRKKETVAPTTSGQVLGWASVGLCSECAASQPAPAPPSAADEQEKRPTMVFTADVGDFIAESGEISLVAIQNKFGVSHREAKTALENLVSEGLLERTGAGNILKLVPAVAEGWKAALVAKQPAKAGA